MSELEIPIGWTKFDDLSKIIETLESGKRPKGGAVGISKGIPSVGGEHLRYDGKFNFKNVKFVPITFFKNMKRGKIQQNDILIVKDGATTGKTSFVDSQFPYDEACVNEHVFIIRPTNDLLPKFLYYYIKSNFAQKKILNKTKGEIGGINTTFVNDFPIVFPKDKKIQKKIVQKLDYLLGELEEKEKLIFALQENKSKIIKKMIKNSEGFLFISLLQTKELQHFKLGDLITDIKLGTNQKAVYDSKGIPVLRMPNIKNGLIDYLDLKYSQFSSKDEKKYLLQKGDVLINRTNSAELVGKSAIFELDEKFAFASYIIRVRVDTKNLNPKFLVYYLNSPLGRKYIESVYIQTAGQANINSENLKQMPLDLPSIDEQKRILFRLESLSSNILDFEKKLEHLISSEKKILNHLSDLKITIINQAFSGKLVN